MFKKIPDTEQFDQSIEQIKLKRAREDFHFASYCVFGLDRDAVKKAIHEKYGRMADTLSDEEANTMLCDAAIESTGSGAPPNSERTPSAETKPDWPRPATDVSLKALSVGSEWILNNPDPFSKPIKAKVLAVKNNWVQYTINSGFDEWTKDVDSFLNAYLPCS